MRKLLIPLLIGALAGIQIHTQAADPKPAPAPKKTATPAVASEAERAAREEMVRRQEQQLIARKLINDGQKLYYDGKYQQAITPLEEAVKTLPRAKATEIDYNRAIHALTDSYYHLADTAYRAGDPEKARQLAGKALEYDPQNRSAESLIIKIKQAEEHAKELAAKPPSPLETPRPDKTPEFQTKKDDIKKLFREGKILMNSGQFDEAEKRFKQILFLDQYNDDAHTLLAELSKARLSSATVGAESTRIHRLWQVTDSWIPPLGKEVQAPKIEEGAGTLSAQAVAVAEITKKLTTIILPEIGFREAVITDVIEFLSKESRRIETEKGIPTEKAGVNFVLQLGESVTAPPPAPAPMALPGEMPTEPEVPTPADVSGTRKITLSLRNIPLVEALKYITVVAGLKYRVEPSAVLVLPKEAVDVGDLITRTYPVAAAAFAPIIESPTTTELPTTTEEVTRMGVGGTARVRASDVRKFFEDAGVPFPPGSSVVYNERTSTLIVRNTADNLEVFERILSTLNIVPTQIEIEAKFVDISQSDLNELAFKWNVGNKQFGDFDVEGGSPSQLFPPAGTPNPSNSDDITSGLRDSSVITANALESLLAAQGFGTVGSTANQVATIRGILTNPQFELVIKALSQKKGSDLLSAPKVTTISGTTAQLKVVQEFIYPTEFEPPQVVAAGGGYGGGGSSTGVTSPTPGAFKTREIGVLLNVTPTVGADGYTINLAVVPEVSEFLGFIDYGGQVAISTGTEVTQIPSPYKQPLFSSRNLTTSIVIWDGQTVVLGGLIREDTQKIDDKVPFLGDLPMLGRLFRSKSTIRSKRNLLIFISARIIDPAGNPIHKS